jgi:hypothetical protein
MMRSIKLQDIIPHKIWKEGLPAYPFTRMGHLAILGANLLRNFQPSTLRSRRVKHGLCLLESTDHFKSCGLLIGGARGNDPSPSVPDIA